MLVFFFFFFSLVKMNENFAMEIVDDFAERRW